MRPFGVLLISVLFILIALVCISSGFMMLLDEGAKSLIFEEFRKVAGMYNISEETLDKIYLEVSFYVVLFGLVYLLDGVGILMLKNWARYLAIFLSLFQMLYSALMIYYDPFAIVYIGIGVLVIWYLLRKDISELFKEKKPSIEERILGQR